MKPSESAVQPRTRADGQVVTPQHVAELARLLAAAQRYSGTRPTGTGLDAVRKFVGGNQ